MLEKMPTKDIIAEETANKISPTTTVTPISSTLGNGNRPIIPPTIRDMVPRDVDDLVNEIKLNLRLKGNCASTSTVDKNTDMGSCTRTGNNNNNNNNGGAGGSVLVTCSGRTKIRSLNHRIAPYLVPPRSGGDSGCHSCGSPRCLRTCLRQPRLDSSDPYQVLQELLREGGLIKEAVRRISKTEKPILKCYDYETDDYDAAAATTTTTTSNLIGLEA